MPTSDFLTFGIGDNNNVLNQAEYAALPARLTGFTAGTARSREANKAWRQSAFVAAMVAQYVADTSNADFLDNGDIIAAVRQFKVAQRNQPLNYVTAAGSATELVITLDPALTQYSLGLPLRVRFPGGVAANATLNVNELGALPITNARGQNVAGGGLPPGSFGTLICTGTSWIYEGASNPLPLSAVVFQTAGPVPFTPAPGFTLGRITVTGGGGGGAGSASSYGGGSGGAGGTSIHYVPLSSTTTYTIIVGAAGAGGPSGNTNGGAGGSSSAFGISATGGEGGANLAGVGPGGRGGLGSGGTINILGGAGGNGMGGSTPIGSTGGASYWGGGARAGTDAPGQAAVTPGAGGGGHYTQAGAGGAGGVGMVVLEYVQ